MEKFEYFVNYLQVPIVLSLGIIGNTLGFLILLKKKLLQIGPRFIFQALFLTDSIYLVQILQPYLAYSYNKDLSLVSSFFCVSYWYFNYLLSTISPWLLSYISVERYISIRYPKWKLILRNKTNQWIYFIVIVALNFAYYSEIIFLNAFQIINNSNDSSSQCVFNNIESQAIISYMDLANRVIIPFILMVISSIMLIESIRKARLSISGCGRRQYRRLKKDIRFAITSILLNCIYLVLSLPISIYIFTPDYFNNIIYLFLFYVYYSSYALNFYLIIFSNYLVRKEFLKSLIGVKYVSST